ncbi:hypothetical protein MIR68_000214 [Amoeboaphelidium protococcarum]|nr:hypothetical protein MIR68_000214 [Amoeboaphelidium protococcarum]KAI3643566.1 hypothetical protein MP228_013121 [Amoeboaphelidium protococcarum]KAI3644683.1 hypothetical protein MP228_010847 [Amoeboaphelidium protococcarum]
MFARRALKLSAQKRTIFGIPEKGVMGKELIDFETHKSEHAAKTAKLWKNIFFVSGIPLLSIVAINAFMIEKAHMEHMAHHPPHFKDLPHLHIRTKPFPWKDGYKSLFYNPKVQPMPPAEE